MVYLVTWIDGYSFSQILAVFFRKGNLGDGVLHKILFDIRIPRMILALVIGAGLSSAGVIFQGLLRNPLAEPYTLGISGMVVLFVNLNSLIFRFLPNIREEFTNTFAALVGSGFSILIVYSIFFRRKWKYSVDMVLLIGVILNIISLSLVELLSNVIDYNKIYSSKFWLLGNLGTSVDSMFYALAVFVVFCIYIFYRKSQILDVLSLGDKQAVYLGIDVKKEQRNLFLVASVLSGICVAYTGIIGFVGLMIPHIARYFVGVKHKTVVITSALLGAFYLLLADFVAKNVIYPAELSVGVITGIVGGIFFIFLVLTRKRGYCG